MSKIIQPPGAPFDFLFQDGLENALTRSQVLLTTVGTGLQTLFTLPLVASALDSNGKGLLLRFFGNLNGVAGTKRVRVLFDATTILDTGALAINNNNYYCEMFFMRLVNSVLYVRDDFFNNAFVGPLATVTHTGKSDQIASINFGAEHSIIIQGDVSAGADSVGLDGVSASIL